MTQKQYKFSLSIRDKHHRTVKKIVDGLLEKGNGALSQSIRDGLRLLNDLRRGNVTVLLDMFPDIAEKICPPETPPDKDDEIAELKQMIKDLSKQIAKQQTVYIPSDATIPPPPPGYPAMKPSALQKALPLIDADDDDSIAATVVLTPLRKMAAGAGHGNGGNLLSGMFGVAG